MMNQRSVVARAVLIIAAFVLSGCANGDGPTNDDRRVIHAWLTCDDCGSGQRAAVEILGDRAVSVLSDALKGPTADQRTIMSNKFDSSYNRAGIGSRVPNLSVAGYTDFRNANYVANYEKRAATSLGDIGTAAAKSALDAAIGDSTNRKYRSDVIRVIKFARSRFEAPTYAGQIAPYKIGFADSVKIVAPAGHPFGPNASVVIEDSLFPAGELPLRRYPDSIRFLSVAAPGVHMISVLASPSAAPDKIAMFVTSIADPGDRSPSGCANPNDIPCLVSHAQPVPIIPASTQPPLLTFFTVTQGTAADAMEFFKIQNPSLASTLPVTARVDWRGDGLLDLRWVMCGTGSPVGQLLHGTTSQTIQLSGSLPPGGCSVLQASLANGTGPIYGQLRMTTP